MTASRFSIRSFLVAPLLASFLMPATMSAQSVSDVIAGTGQPGISGDGLTADQAQFNLPDGLSFDNAGNLLVADGRNHRLRRIDTRTGIVTTVAGRGGAGFFGDSSDQRGGAGFFGDGGPASLAYLNTPVHPAVDSAGNIYFSDSGNHRIRKIAPDGKISTFAGNGTAAFIGDGLPATSASLSSPAGIALGANDELFIVDAGNGRIRAVNSSGIIRTVAGGGTQGLASSGASIPATTASLGTKLRGVIQRSVGDLLLTRAESPSLLRVSGTSIAVVVGSGFTGGFGNSEYLAPDAAGNVVFAGDLSCCRRPLLRLSADLSQVTMLAAEADFNGLAISPEGTIVASAQSAHQIRRVRPAGPLPDLSVQSVTSPGAARQAATMSLSAIVTNTGAAASPATTVRFSFSTATPSPTNLALIGEVAVGPLNPGQSVTVPASFQAPLASPPETNAFLIAAIDPANVIAEASETNNQTITADPTFVRTALPGTEGPLLVSIAGNDASPVGYGGETQGARRAAINVPGRMTLDPAGHVVFCDVFNHRVRRIDTASGRISLVAGDGLPRFRGDGGPASLASLNLPSGVAYDAAGNLYIADTQNNRIRRVDAQGNIATVAGTGNAGFDGDRQPGLEASLNHPQDVVVDAAGDVLIADTDNDRIRRWVPFSAMIFGLAGPDVALPIPRGPIALDVAPDGTLLAVSSKCCQVSALVRIDRRAGVAQVLRLENCFIYRDVASDSSGRIYLGRDNGCNAGPQLLRLDPSTLNLTPLLGVGTRADGTQPLFTVIRGTLGGLLIDRNGDVLVARSGSNDVSQINRLNQGTSLSDLALTSVTAPSNAKAGDVVQVTASVTNSGQSTAAGTPLIFVLSSDVSPTIGRDEVLGEAPDRTPVAPGASRSVALRVRIPFHIRAAKSYFIGAIVDPDNVVPESVERNNVRASGAIFVDPPAQDNVVNPIEVIAGKSQRGDSPDGTSALTAALNFVLGITVDPAGNIVFTEFFGDRIRRINRTTGLLETVAGIGGPPGFSGDGGPAIRAQLNHPTFMVYDRSGNLYFSDGYAVDGSNQRVRRVSPDGLITTIAGNGTAGGLGDGGPATSAQLNDPVALVLDSDGGLLIGERGSQHLRKVDFKTGFISTVSGPSGPFSGSAGFAVRRTPGGDLLVSTGTQVQRFDPASGASALFAGGGNAAASGSPQVGAALDFIRQIALGPAGEAIIATQQGRVYRADPLSKTLQLVAGHDDNFAAPAALREATGYPLNDIGDIFVSSDGTVLISNFGTDRIYRTRLPPFSTSFGSLLQPLVASVFPSQVPNDAVVRLTLTGSGFGGASFVRLTGPAAATLSDLVVESDSVLSGLLPSGLLPGSYLPVVSAAGGTSATATMGLTVRGPSTRPDVALTAVTGPASVAQGGIVALTASTRNLGNAATTGFNVTFGLAPASGGASVLLGSTPVSDVAAAQAKDVAGSFTVPPSLSSGSYVVEAVADPEGFLDDSDVGNNKLRSRQPIAVTPGQPPAALPPVAIIGLLARNGGGAQVIGLDGTGSLDPAGAGLTYRWELLTKPQGAAAFSSTLARPSYLAGSPGSYVFQLTVSSKTPQPLSSVAVASLRIAQAPPRADAGPDRQIVLPDAQGRVASAFTTRQVVLDGSLSSDPGGGAPAYRWTLLLSPEGSGFKQATGLLDAETSFARVVFPPETSADGRQLAAGVYRFLLEVTGPTGLSDTASVQVVVLDPNKLAPTADAGPDRQVSVRIVSRSPLILAPDIPDPAAEGAVRLADVVRLDGRQSRDPEQPPRSLTYRWRVRQTPRGSLAGDASLVAPQSATPGFLPDRAGVYTFSLDVSNGLFDSAQAEVRILVNVARDEDSRERFNRSPFAIALARDETGQRRSLDAPAPPAFNVDVDRVFLDGSLSGDLDDGANLSYRWTQLSGPSAQLAPSASAPVASFVPRAPGSYRFGLVVTDPLGAASESSEVELAGLAAGRAAARFSIAASATRTPGTGLDTTTGGGDEAHSLRATLPTTVTLAAVFSESAPPPSRRLAFRWDQAAGPSALLLADPPEPGTSATSLARFTPTTIGVHEFRCSVTRSDSTTATLGLSRLIRVLVDSSSRGVPRAVASVNVARAKEGSPCRLVTLDGAASRPVGTAGGSLRYQWVQQAGPTVTLSNPNSSVTTFVTPELGDGQARQLLFILLVDQAGAARSIPATVSVVVTGTAQVEQAVSLLPGLNLLGLPVNPSTAVHEADADDLVKLYSASFVARLAAPEGASRPRFEVYLPGQGVPPFRVQGNEGFLVFRGGASTALTVPIRGKRWPATLLTRTLPQGPAIVHFPRGASGLTSTDLSRQTTSTALFRTTVGTDKRGRFEVVAPGLLGSFALSPPGSAYLLLRRRAGLVRLAGQETDCP